MSSYWFTHPTVGPFGDEYYCTYLSLLIVVGQGPGKFTQTYLSKLVNNFIILLLPDSQTLLQVKHRVLDGECN